MRFMDKEKVLKKHKEIVGKLLEILEKKRKITEKGNLISLKELNIEEKVFMERLFLLWGDSWSKKIIEENEEQIELLKRLNKKVAEVFNLISKEMESIKSELTKKTDIKNILEKIEPQKERKGYFVDKEG